MMIDNLNIHNLDIWVSKNGTKIFMSHDKSVQDSRIWYDIYIHHQYIIYGDNTYEYFG